MSGSNKAATVLLSSLMGGALISIVTAPLGIPLCKAVTEGSKPDLTHLARWLMDGDLWASWMTSIPAFVFDIRAILPFALWTLICALGLAAAIIWMLSEYPDREVKEGVLGHQEAIDSPSRILSRCDSWNGRGTPPAGVAVGFVRSREVVFPTTHALVTAPSGSAKTRASVYPTIDVLTFSGENNLIVTDPSLEIYATTKGALEGRGYPIFLLDFENPRAGIRWNPLSLITKLHSEGHAAEAEDRAKEMGSILYPTSGGENDIFASAAGGAFAAVAHAVATDPAVPDDQRHLWSVVKAIQAGSISGPEPLKAWLRSYGVESPQVSMAATFLASESKMLSSILATMHDGLQPFTSSNTKWLTSGTDLEIDWLLGNRSAVFLHTLGPGSPTNRIASLFLAQHWAETQRMGKRRGLRECFVIGDEFHSVPKFSLVTAMEQGRKYGLHYILYLQSLSGLDQYKTPKEDGKDAIIANCDVKVLYRAGAIQDAEYFEALGGFKTVNARNVGSQRNGSGKGTSVGHSEQKIPVWPKGDLLERNPMEDGVLVFRAASGSTPSGRFEIPIKEVSRTFVAAHFGTLGTREFEKGHLEEVFDELDETALSIPLEVEGWSPDFDEFAPDEARTVLQDEMHAWDEALSL